MTINWRPISNLKTRNDARLYLFCNEIGIVELGRISKGRVFLEHYDDDFCGMPLSDFTYFALVNLPSEYAE